MASDSLLGIRVFCRIVELKGFAAAARSLDLSPAMVSKHLMQLERRLGTRLLHRSSRHLSLTEIGAAYHSQALPLLEQLDTVEAQIQHATDTPRGTLRVTAPVWCANPAFANLLAGYRARHPEVSLDLDLSGRIVNLVEEGFDLALRAARAPGENLVARTLGTVKFSFVAAPRLLRTTGTPLTLTELARLPFLLYTLVTESGFSVDGPHGLEVVSFTSNFRSTSDSLLHLAALQGMGYALLPDRLIAADLAAGRLVLLLPDYPTPEIPLLGIYPHRKYLSSKVRSFLDFMIEADRPRSGTIRV
jgi:DNA-binding transcriptional LysR family regulator